MARMNWDRVRREANLSMPVTSAEPLRLPLVESRGSRPTSGDRRFRTGRTELVGPATTSSMQCPHPPESLMTSRRGELWCGKFGDGHRMRLRPASPARLQRGAQRAMHRRTLDIFKVHRANREGAITGWLLAFGFSLRLRTCRGRC